MNTSTNSLLSNNTDYIYDVVEYGVNASKNNNKKFKSRNTEAIDKNTCEKKIKLYENDNNVKEKKNKLIVFLCSIKNKLFTKKNVIPQDKSDSESSIHNLVEENKSDSESSIHNLVEENKLDSESSIHNLVEENKSDLNHKNKTKDHIYVTLEPSMINEYDVPESQISRQIIDEKSQTTNKLSPYVNINYLITDKPKKPPRNFAIKPLKPPVPTKPLIHKIPDYDKTNNLSEIICTSSTSRLLDS